MSGHDLGGYIEVKDRISHFYASCPDGRIISSVPRIISIGGREFVEVTTTVYRGADDAPAARGSAWEQFPGKTNFTRDSEMMNAETSAIGRALAAAGVSSDKGVASREDVMRRREEQDEAARLGERITDVAQAEIQARIAALTDDQKEVVKAEWKARRIRPLAQLTVGDHEKVELLLHEVEA